MFLNNKNNGLTSYLSCTYLSYSVIIFLKNTKDESKLKRKCDQDSDEMSSKNQRVDNFGEVSDESITSDLIVLGLSFKATTSDIREYFGTFGPLELAELKTEDTG